MKQELSRVQEAFITNENKEVKELKKEVNDLKRALVTANSEAKKAHSQTEKLHAQLIQTQLDLKKAPVHLSESKKRNDVHDDTLQQQQHKNSMTQEAVTKKRGRRLLRKLSKKENIEKQSHVVSIPSSQSHLELPSVSTGSNVQSAPSIMHHPMMTTPANTYAQLASPLSNLTSPIPQFQSTSTTLQYTPSQDMSFMTYHNNINNMHALTQLHALNREANLRTDFMMHMLYSRHK